ncbi:Uncharacterized membrane protein [Marinilactibacillus piezotolerans]|uniref:Uncharacterized membrane protein n=1 Tax=Marinilactibacillus piezotolerans TaxID=258723 RepID=A0A1I3ZDG6_9LACT|nr:DUF975 family protein [Marinilactibacillus piezotolerans]SFK41950.1 Uncharacterized membrane protein [Marinilactibacillus piezotolerans]
MLSVGEIRSTARQILNGKWKDAALLNVIPVLIAIIFTGEASNTLDFFGIEFFDQNVVNEATEYGMNNFINFKSIIVDLVAILFATGVAFTLLDLVRNSHSKIDPLSDSLRIFKQGHVIQVLAIYIITGFFVILWSLLLIIPGIIASLAYSQAYYIYKDSEANGENLTVMDCISRSKELMAGYKGKLFLLELSFIGWHLIGALTFGLGYLFITPYIQTAKAVFYNDLLDNSQVY